MTRRLRRTVVAGGVTYLAGAAETPELARLVSNGRAWEGEPDTPAPILPAPPPPVVKEPPRSGRGSSETAWRAYAENLGIEVPEDAGRDDVIALVDAQNSGE